MVSVFVPFPVRSVSLQRNRLLWLISYSTASSLPLSAVVNSNRTDTVTTDTLQPLNPLQVHFLDRRADFEAKKTISPQSPCTPWMTPTTQRA